MNLMPGAHKGAFVWPGQGFGVAVAGVLILNQGKHRGMEKLSIPDREEVWQNTEKKQHPELHSGSAVDLPGAANAQGWWRYGQEMPRVVYIWSLLALFP